MTRFSPEKFTLFFFQDDSQGILTVWKARSRQYVKRRLRHHCPTKKEARLPTKKGATLLTKKKARLRTERHCPPPTTRRLSDKKKPPCQRHGGPKNISQNENLS